MDESNKNMAADLLELPEMKATISFLKKRIKVLSERKGMNDFFKKRQLTPVIMDYKRLELLVREMFNRYAIVLKDKDNDQAVGEFQLVIAGLTDHVQGCLVRYKIDIEKEIASNA